MLKWLGKMLNLPETSFENHWLLSFEPRKTCLPCLNAQSFSIIEKKQTKGSKHIQKLIILRPIELKNILKHGLSENFHFATIP